MTKALDSASFPEPTIISAQNNTQRNQAALKAQMYQGRFLNLKTVNVSLSAIVHPFP